MRTSLASVLVAGLAAAATVSAGAVQEPQMDFGSWSEPSSLMEMEATTVPDAATIGYVPVSSAFDNPGVGVAPTPTIPTNPDCTVRPQTVVEIKRMRRSAARIAQMIQTEVTIMEKRKTYVEQMTSYLNDRIRELNKVKSELDQEYRWIEVSNQRINELAEKEKLIKMQDILSCLHTDAQNLQGKKQTQVQEITAMQSQAAILERNIEKIKANINNVNSGAGKGQHGQQVIGGDQLLQDGGQEIIGF